MLDNTSPCKSIQEIPQPRLGSLNLPVQTHPKIEREGGRGESGTEVPAHTATPEISKKEVDPTGETNDFKAPASERDVEQHPESSEAPGPASAWSAGRRRGRLPGSACNSDPRLRWGEGGRGRERRGRAAGEPSAEGGTGCSRSQRWPAAGAVHGPNLLTNDSVFLFRPDVRTPQSRGGRLGGRGSGGEGESKPSAEVRREEPGGSGGGAGEAGRDGDGARRTPANRPVRRFLGCRAGSGD